MNYDFIGKVHNFFKLVDKDLFVFLRVCKKKKNCSSGLKCINEVGVSKKKK